MVDLIFLRILEGQGQEKRGVEFLKSAFGQNREEFLRIRNSETTMTMGELFCSVCLIFGCGIHAPHDPKVLKYGEDDECICDKADLRHPKTPLSEFPEYSIFQERSLNKCVLKKLLQAKYQKNISCRILQNKTLGKREIFIMKKFPDSKQFYQPCDHKGPCSSGKCTCFSSGTPCEPFCGCKSCSNAIFCTCKKCEKNCPCYLKNRECTDFCKCVLEKNTGDRCRNRPVEQGVTRATSVHHSLKHGLGLFSEEFIPENSFVSEYTGEIITDKEAERRGNFYEMNKLSYLFNSTFQGGDCLHSIDAFFLGNKSRFINHSVSKANLKSKILVSHGNVKVVFYSLRDIFKGEELLFDYQFTDEHKERHGIID